MKDIEVDEFFMEKAICLARNGVGKVNPNPLVGAVIVKNSNIIAEGYHKKYGDFHAERDRDPVPYSRRRSNHGRKVPGCCAEGAGAEVSVPITVRNQDPGIR